MAEVSKEIILKYLTEGESIFKYSQDSDKVLESNAGAASKDNLVSAFHLNIITISDLFICLAIAKLTVGTERMILSTINYMKTTYDKELAIPDVTSAEHRLRDLVKNGFVYEFNYKRNDVSNKNQRFYTLTTHTYQFLNTVLKYDESYDQFFSITPLDEVVKYLAANSVLTKLLDISKSVEEFVTKDKIFLRDSRAVEFFYGKVKTTVVRNGVEKKFVLFIEPVYYNYNKRRISQEKFEANLETRMNVINALVDSTMASKRKPVLLIVAENREGMTRIMEYMAKKNPTVCQQFMYFTTEYLVNKFGFNGTLFTFKEMVDGRVKADIKAPDFMELR